jgi:hypothetical protein
VAISKDGGEHWDSVYYDKQLPDPVCQGSLLNIKKRGGNIGWHSVMRPIQLTATT